LSDTTRLQLPLLAAAQAQKHVTHNEAILTLDGLVQLAAKSATTTAQPSSPSDGDLYLLPAGKTGADWGAYSNGAIAHYYDGVWHQYAPGTGWMCFVQDTKILYFYDGSAWQRVLANASDGSASTPAFAFSADADNGLYRIGTNNPGMAAGGSLVQSWSTLGNTQPLQPAFYAARSADVANVTGNGTGYSAVFDSEILDRGNNYNNTTGVFTAPVTGVYLFNSVVRLSNFSSSFNQAYIQLQTTARAIQSFIGNPGAMFETNSGLGIFGFGSSWIAPMTAGDTAYIFVNVKGGSKVITFAGNGAYSCFSGILLA